MVQVTGYAATKYPNSSLLIPILLSLIYIHNSCTYQQQNSKGITLHRLGLTYWMPEIKF